jgi:hypothetical protein
MRSTIRQLGGDGAVDAVTTCAHLLHAHEKSLHA